MNFGSRLLFINFKSELIIVDVNCNGTILAVGANTKSGSFVEFFDVLAFEPNHETQVNDLYA